MILRNFLNINLVFMSAILIICTSFSFDAYAKSGKGDIFTRFKKPMPELKLMSRQEFNKATRPVRKKPYGQDVLEYSIRIPKGWTEREDKSSSNFLLSQKLFLGLNVFYGKPSPDGRSRIEIEALNLEGSLTAEQWYLKYILEGGLTTEGFITHDGNKIESLMVVMDQDSSYYVRTMVLLNGDKVVMVKYFVPAQLIRVEAPMQEQVLSSFKLINKVNRTPVKMSKYRFLDIAELKYPSSWKLFAKKLRTIDRMDVSLLNLREIEAQEGRPLSVSTEGKLEVALVTASHSSTLIDEVKKYKQKIEADGMLIGEQIEVVDKIDYNENIDFAITEVYRSVDSTNNLSEYELWFSVMVGGNYYYFFTLLTPSRNERFALWAENSQNYKEILKSFTPMSGAFMERDY